MKLDDFPERLAAFLAERQDIPYAWGTNDCALFAADAVQAVRGDDPISDLRGQWHDEASAMALLESLGGLIGFMDSRFKRRQTAALAQRGDVVMVRMDDGSPSLAVVDVTYCAAPADLGLLYIPTTHARIAWEV